MAEFLGGPMAGGPMNGGPMNGGPMNGGPMNGGPMAGSVVSDGYATPLYASALIRHRGASIDPAEIAPLWHMPKSRFNGRLFQWDPWVRSYLFAQDLIEGLTFQLGTVGPSPNASEPYVKLLANVNAPNGKPKKPLTLATIIRPKRKVFESQVAQVLDWASLRDERMAEVLTQIESPLCFWGMLIPLQTDRLRNTRELIEAAVQLAVFVEMRFKHELGCWRPTDYSAQVQPMITTPRHASLPSGHCTQSYVIAALLRALLRSNKSEPAYRSFNKQVQRLCERISMNRVVAGVHFPVDNVAGRMLGSVLGDYVVHRCGGSEQLSVGVFDGLKYEKEVEHGFAPSTQWLFPKTGKTLAAFYAGTGNGRPSLGRRAPMLTELWARARTEVRDLGLSF